MLHSPSTEQTRHLWRGRFLYLLFAQCLLLVSFPYLDQPGWGLVLFRLVALSTLVSTIYAIRRNRAHFVIAAILGGSAAILNAFYVFHPSRQLAIPTLIFMLVFLAYTAASLLRVVVGADRVTPDTICGALSVYMLMALTWAVAYLLLVNVHPGAIAMDAARYPNHVMDWEDCLFFSFVTLTTLGFGDIVPVSAQARSLTILEAVCGILYVAVLVARLVGLHAAAKYEARPHRSVGEDSASPTLTEKPAS